METSGDNLQEVTCASVIKGIRLRITIFLRFRTYSMPLSDIKVLLISPNVSVVLYASYREKTCKFEISDCSVYDALQIG